ncbi:MAG: hypothetical protein ACP5DZ_08740 [Bacteroidales bacterium]
MKVNRFTSLLNSLSLFAGYILFAEQANAQIRFPVPSQQEIRNFESSKTYIVKEDKLISDYNLALEDAVQKHWHATDAEVISSTEFKNMRTDESASFVYMNQVHFKEDKTLTAYEYLFLSMGDKSGDIDDMPDLCAVPLAVKGTKQEEFVYKIGLILEFMQGHVRVCKNHPDLNEKDVINFYSSREISLDDKKLWLLKNEVEADIRNQTEMASIYPYEFQFVDKEDIKAAIDQVRDDILILHLTKAGENRYCFKLIVTAGKGGLYFYDYHRTKKQKPSLLLKTDIKKFIH